MDKRKKTVFYASPKVKETIARVHGCPDITIMSFINYKKSGGALGPDFYLETLHLFQRLRGAVGKNLVTV